MKAKDIIIIVICIAIIVGLAWFLKYVLQNGYDEIKKVFDRFDVLARLSACKGRMQVLWLN